MTLDPRSFVLGFMAAYAFSIIVCAALLAWDARQARKARDAELEREMQVAVESLEADLEAGRAAAQLRLVN